MSMKELRIPIDMRTIGTLATPATTLQGEEIIFDMDMTRSPLKTYDLNASGGEFIFLPNTMYYIYLNFTVTKEEASLIKNFFVSQDITLIGLNPFFALQGHKDSNSTTMVISITSVMKLKYNFNNPIAELVVQYDDENVPMFIQRMTPTEEIPPVQNENVIFDPKKDAEVLDAYDTEMIIQQEEAKTQADAIAARQSTQAGSTFDIGGNN